MCRDAMLASHFKPHWREFVIRAKSALAIQEQDTSIASLAFLCIYCNGVFFRIFLSVNL